MFHHYTFYNNTKVFFLLQILFVSTSWSFMINNHIPSTTLLVRHDTNNLDNSNHPYFWSPCGTISNLFSKQQQKNRLKLYNIHEWREMTFDSITEVDNVLAKIDKTNNSNDGTTLPREICLLPFSCQDILLQGETKQLHLYEDRYIQAFETIMKDYNGILGLGLFLNNESYTPTQLKPIPICEIISYSKIDDFGVFCTIRVVSRGSILRIISNNGPQPFMKVSCTEKSDLCIEKDKFDLANVLASNIENFVETLSRLENQLEQQQLHDYDSGGERVVTSSLSSYDDTAEEEVEEEIPFRVSFQKAYASAKETDCQGYKVISSSPLFWSKFSKCKRTVQDLTAISWAVFCSSDSRNNSNHNNNNNQIPDNELLTTAKIQALTSTTLLGRLHMGLLVLRHKKKVLEEELALIKKQQ